MQKNINYIKTKRGLTYKDLSKILNIPQITIESIGNGSRSNPQILSIITISKGLNISLDDLVLKDLELEDKNKQ